MEIEVDKVCRICLKESHYLEPIFSYELDQIPIINILLKVCYNLRIIPQLNDSLPSQLCYECLDVLCRAHKLNDTSVRSEIQLKEILQKTTGTVIKEEKIDFEDHKFKLEQEEDFLAPVGSYFIN